MKYCEIPQYKYWQLLCHYIIWSLKFRANTPILNLAKRFQIKQSNFLLLLVVKYCVIPQYKYRYNLHHIHHSFDAWSSEQTHLHIILDLTKRFQFKQSNKLLLVVKYCVISQFKYRCHLYHIIHLMSEVQSKHTYCWALQNVFIE